MGKTRDLFKKIGDIKGSFHSRMGMIKDRNGIALPIQALRGLPCLGLFSVVWHVRHIEEPTLGGVLLCSSVSQAFDGPASLFFSCRCWRVGGERLW